MDPALLISPSFDSMMASSPSYDARENVGRLWRQQAIVAASGGLLELVKPSWAPSELSAIRVVDSDNLVLTSKGKRRVAALSKTKCARRSCAVMLDHDGEWLSSGALSPVDTITRQLTYDYVDSPRPYSTEPKVSHVEPDCPPDFCSKRCYDYVRRGIGRRGGFEDGAVKQRLHARGFTLDQTYVGMVQWIHSDGARLELEFPYTSIRVRAPELVNGSVTYEVLGEFAAPDVDRAIELALQPRSSLADLQASSDNLHAPTSEFTAGLELLLAQVADTVTHYRERLTAALEGYNARFDRGAVRTDADMKALVQHQVDIAISAGALRNATRLRDSLRNYRKMPSAFAGLAPYLLTPAQLEVAMTSGFREVDTFVAEAKRLLDDGAKGGA